MRRTEKRGGLTIVEVVVSLALITLVTGGFLGLLLENIRAGGTMDCNYAALNIAKSRIDRIRELRRDKGYSYLYTAAESEITVDGNGTPDEDGDFTRTTAITPDFAGRANLTKITVTVRYRSSKSQSDVIITLTSLISPYI